MKYMILDYDPSQGGNPEKEISLRKLLCRFRWGKRIWKRMQKTKLYRTLTFYIKCRRSMPCCKEVFCCDLEFVYLSLPLRPREIGQLSADKLCRMIVKSFLFPVDAIELFAVQTELRTYMPPNFSVCGSREEVYINIMKQLIPRLCGRYNISKKTARLLFLDDGGCDADTVIQSMSRSWNYVSVCSNRQETLEELYHQLYEEEGLMVESLEFDRRTRCQGDVVIDLTEDWRGIHRMYPADALVLDLTFSREKEQYLRAKQARFGSYIQLAGICRVNEILNYPVT